MIVKLPTEHHLEFLSLKGGCTGSSEYTLVKMPNCWKSLVTAQLYMVSSLSETSQQAGDRLRSARSKRPIHKRRI